MGSDSGHSRSPELSVESAVRHLPVSSLCACVQESSPLVLPSARKSATFQHTGSCTVTTASSGPATKNQILYKTR